MREVRRKKIDLPGAELPRGVANDRAARAFFNEQNFDFRMLVIRTTECLAAKAHAKQRRLAGLWNIFHDGTHNEIWACFTADRPTNTKKYRILP